eukprot:CAMPEP_0184675654 /NCGR_PEP_ID=MMETSP0308-20130426/87891_1 /TAXON_ID=38269 /ORGANISM="Gloeochaete witrockiana, Strain SAG 46.84" /LENGTH=138 /DNA_ID=CAMNT_0027123375 /DNA_START=91 /DNA_END=507 /DNA_ORIENTATION=+
MFAFGRKSEGDKRSKQQSPSQADKKAPVPPTPQQRIQGIQKSVNELLTDIGILDAETESLVRGDSESGAKLTRRCAILSEQLMKFLLELDEVQGDDNVRALRKAEVVRIQEIIDSLDEVKQRTLSYSAAPQQPVAANG